MPGALSNDGLTRLYTWVDGMNLSRPKRNIARDFSDGVLVAEVRLVLSENQNILKQTIHRRTAMNMCYLYQLKVLVYVPGIR